MLSYFLTSQDLSAYTMHFLETCLTYSAHVQAYPKGDQKSSLFQVY